MARRDGLAKVLGTNASVGGATLITLYKGPPLLHLQRHQIQGDTLEGDQSSRKMQNWHGVAYTCFGIVFMGWMDGFSGLVKIIMTCTDCKLKLQIRHSFVSLSIYN